MSNFSCFRNEYTDWDRPSAMDPLSMRDSMTSALSDALVVAPLMHVVHLHAQRSANPSGTFFYHYQGPVMGVHDPAHDQGDVAEYSVRYLLMFHAEHIGRFDESSVRFIGASR